MLDMILKCIKNTQQNQACSSHQTGKQRPKARHLPPVRIVRQRIEFVRVAHMVDGKDGSRKGHASDRAAGNEDGLEGEGGNVADEGHLGVDLAWVARLADGEPANKQDGEGREPGDASNQGEEPQPM